MITSNGSYRPLTPRQARVFLYIQQCVDFGIPPTFRQVARRFCWSGPNAANQHLQALRRKGWLTLDGTARGIRLLRRLYEVSEVKRGRLVATGQWLAVEVKQ